MQKNYRFVEYILVICFIKFVQSAMNARREVDEYPKLKCCHRNNEIACQQLLRLSNYAS